jgi:hypothetical protein
VAAEHHLGSIVRHTPEQLGVVGQRGMGVGRGGHRQSQHSSETQPHT